MAVKAHISETQRLAGPGLRAFFAIADRWGLDNEQRRTLLGSLPESTFYKYAADPQSARLTHDTLERISHLVGIFKAVNVLLPRPEQADAWVKRPNDAALFKGSSALAFMLSGRFDDLIAVRRYLDAERGW
ncbi:MAG: antitoxin Xre-like helix-turn-helix domain-containing protein [Candidatus Baltobacteraceae bacterium]